MFHKAKCGFHTIVNLNKNLQYIKRIVLIVIEVLLLTNECAFAKKQSSDLNYRKEGEMYGNNGSPEEILSLLNKQLNYD